jgi:membrane protease YdiL (CAAX protease family)
MNHLEYEVESPPKVMWENQSSPRLRTVELILVLAVAFTTPLFTSFYESFNDPPDLTPVQIKIRLFYGVAFEIIALSVLAYVLFRQGRGFNFLKIAFRWKDIGVSLLLFVLFVTAFLGSYKLFTYGQYSPAENNGPSPGARFSVGAILFALVTPIYEELIVRAYTMSEIKDLTGSGALAVIISVLIQILIRFDGGWEGPLAFGAGFLVFALYYAWHKRITPIILAHCYFSLVSFWGSIRY